MKYAFTRTTGLEEAKAFLVRALDAGKFPHALLIHGPEGVGQNPLLLDLADILLCESAAERPCGRCGSCLQGRSGNSERMLFLLPLEKAGGDGEDRRELEGPQLEELIEKVPRFLGDPYGYRLAERDLIRIAQIRDLQVRLGFAGAAGRSRVVLVPWAETFNTAAANALLKTLEEPPAGTYFLLSSANRKSILTTILSRCSHLPVAALEDKAFAAAAASRREWWSGEAAAGEGIPPARLMPFAEGSLGVLLSLHRDGGEALLEEASAFAAAALQADWRAFSDYLDASAAFDKLDTAAPLLAFVLRAARALHRLRLAAGRAAPASPPPGAVSGPIPLSLSAESPRWIPEALAGLGWDPSLAPIFSALDRAADLSAFASLAESILSAVQDYCKPRMAALGAWLEREPRPAAAAAAALPSAGEARGRAVPAGARR